MRFVILLFLLAELAYSVDFNIEGIFHEEWCPVEGEDPHPPASPCSTHCFNVCVNYIFNTHPGEEFTQRAQNLSTSERHVIIVGADYGIAISPLTVLTPPYRAFRVPVSPPPPSPTDTPNSINHIQIYPYPRAPAASSRTPTRGTVWSGLGGRVKRFLTRYLQAVHQKTVIIFHDYTAAKVVGELQDFLTSNDVYANALVYCITELQTKGTFEKVLQSLHQQFYLRGIYVLLLGEQQTVLSVFRTINKYDGRSKRTTNFRHLSNWLVLTVMEKPNAILPVVDSLENVALLDLHTHRLELSNIAEVFHTLQAAVDAYLMAEPDVCPSFQVFMHNLTLRVTQALGEGARNDNVTLRTVLGVGNTSGLHTVTIDRTVEISEYVDKIFPNKKYKWNRRHLLVSTKPWPGYVIRIMSGNKTIGYRGMCIELLNSFATALNFTYTIEEVPDGEWGLLVNGAWTGLVRQLKDRVIDIALADLSIHSSRDSVMDYIYPAFKTEVIDILYRLHDDSDLGLDDLLTPVRTAVLPFLVLSLCGVTLLFLLVEHTDDVITIKKHPRKVGLLVWRTVWYLIGSFLSQGSVDGPRTCSGRLVMASWWLFCVVFAAMYSASLTVSFCVQRTAVPFTSLQDMVTNSRYQWGMFNGSINMLIFQTSETDLYKRTYRRMMEFARQDPGVLSKEMEVQLQRVVNNKYAFISSRNSLNVMIQRAPPGVTLTTVGETLNPSGAALGVPSGSPLLHQLEWVMGNIKETGILQFWIGQYWNKTRPPLNSFELGGEPLPLKKLYSAFSIVAIGTSIALGVLFSEVVFRYLKNHFKTFKTTTLTKISGEAK